MAVYSPITAARFWSKVDVKWSAKDCWNWRGATRKGYGNIKIEGQSHSSNRVALELFTGEPLGELMALHTCDNKLCCNPRHLYAGDASDNMTDIGGDCLRCGQCEGYGCNCTTEEQQSAYIDHLIATKDAQDAKIKALVEYVESIADWMASNGYDNTSDLAFLAAAKETT